MSCICNDVLLVDCWEHRPIGPEWPWCTADYIATSNRVGAVLLARLRSGHTPLLKVDAQLLDPAVDPTCPLCKVEPQTLELWLQRCPNLDVFRQRTFGSPSPPLRVLTNDPEKALALAGALDARLNNNNKNNNTAMIWCINCNYLCSTPSTHWNVGANFFRAS